jgi:hypothetical protein
MWELRRFTTLWAFTAFYMDSFTIFIFMLYYKLYILLWLGSKYVTSVTGSRYLTSVTGKQVPCFSEWEASTLQQLFLVVCRSSVSNVENVEQTLWLHVPWWVSLKYSTIMIFWEYRPTVNITLTAVYTAKWVESLVAHLNDAVPLNEVYRQMVGSSDRSSFVR